MSTRVGKPWLYRILMVATVATIGLCNAPNAVEPPEIPPTFNYFENQIKTPALQNASDFMGYLGSPFSWDGEQWKTAGTVAAATGLLILVDKPIFDYFDRRNLTTFNNATQGFHGLGKSTTLLYALPAIYATGVVLDDSKLQHGTYMAIKSFGFQIITTQFLKDLFFRKLEGDPYDFQGPKWKFPSDEGALPSGHAGFAWAVLTSYAEEYREDQPWVTTLCYSSAILSSATLVTQQKHWISDVVLGAAIGYYTALYVRDMDQKKPAFSVYPLVVGGGWGIGISGRY
ncbi:MAG: phosphatase PAP2 family protein [Candidatus Margulisiibacteriota bacterium]